MTTPRCGFEGNTDTYGLGVRLGIYMSWLSVILGSAWLPRIRADLIDALVVFTLAFFAATILVTADRDSTYSVEIIIMAYIFFGGIITSAAALVAPPPYNALSYNRFSLWRGTVIILCAIAMAVYSFWFYWFARPFNATPCGTWVFPFGILHHTSTRMGPMLLYAIVSATTGVGWPIAALLVAFLAIPDLLTILRSTTTKNTAESEVKCDGASGLFSKYEIIVRNIAAKIKSMYLKQKILSKKMNR